MIGDHAKQEAKTFGMDHIVPNGMKRGLEDSGEWGERQAERTYHDPKPPVDQIVSVEDGYERKWWVKGSRAEISRAQSEITGIGWV